MGVIVDEGQVNSIKLIFNSTCVVNLPDLREFVVGHISYVIKVIRVCFGFTVTVPKPDKSVGFAGLARFHLKIIRHRSFLAIRRYHLYSTGSVVLKSMERARDIISVDLSKVKASSPVTTDIGYAFYASLCVSPEN